MKMPTFGDVTHEYLDGHPNLVDHLCICCGEPKTHPLHAENDSTYEALAAAKRLIDQAVVTAGDAEGRARVLEDGGTVLYALRRSAPPDPTWVEGWRAAMDWLADYKGVDGIALAEEMATRLPSVPPGPSEAAAGPR